MAPVVNKVYPGFLCGCDPTEDCVGAPGGIEVCVARAVQTLEKVNSQLTPPMNDDSILSKVITILTLLIVLGSLIKWFYSVWAKNFKRGNRVETADLIEI
ncbi:hypothetical protein PRIPAC_94826 [Pristionchus pacificus]|uniref:Uncharacterized protein n=1 Tax=Pristionchus pacificus TaxID=54126 RepID=A0A2A6BR72_PRIPA|nr:hypothetical protein PRIPAC_94826 [Pristionchus pacificus]|eukprot:PDM68251.1 hypothetical protein PRIPAC_46295 [Pristionchus pacificus]